MHNESTPSLPRKLTRNELRLQRVAMGLPRYSDHELAYRREYGRRYSREYRAKHYGEISSIERTQALRKRRTALIRQIKLARGCADCGYRSHPEALDFDHLPGAEKLANVSRMALATMTEAVILAEIEKCEVVCANCHRIRTFERRTPA